MYKFLFTSQKTLSLSVIKTSHLMLYKEIIVVRSEIHTEHIDTLCGAERRIIYRYPDRTAQ